MPRISDRIFLLLDLKANKESDRAIDIKLSSACKASISSSIL